jgi:hypothetical protein
MRLLKLFCEYSQSSTLLKSEAIPVINQATRHVAVAQHMHVTGRLHVPAALPSVPIEQ